MIEISPVVIEIWGIENGDLAVPVNNTLVCRTSFLAADTQPCVLMPPWLQYYISARNALLISYHYRQSLIILPPFHLCNTKWLCFTYCISITFFDIWRGLQHCSQPWQIIIAKLTKLCMSYVVTYVCSSYTWFCSPQACNNNKKKKMEIFEFSRNEN